MTRNVPAALAWGRCRDTRTLCVAGRLAAVAAGVTSSPMRDRPIADGFATHHQPGIEASPRPGRAGTCTSCRPTAPVATGSVAPSRKSPTRPNAAACSPAPDCPCNASITSSPPTTPTASPSGEPPPPARCPRRGIDGGQRFGGTGRWPVDRLRFASGCALRTRLARTSADRSRDPSGRLRRHDDQFLERVVPVAPDAPGQMHVRPRHGGPRHAVEASAPTLRGFAPR